MTKKQKIWLGVFVAIFLVPEILFFTTPSLIKAISGKGFSQISSLLINYGFFLRHPLYLLLIIIVEWIGIVGLLIMSLRFKKIVLSFFSIIILLWLSFIFYLVYITGFFMSFP